MFLLYSFNLLLHALSDLNASFIICIVQHLHEYLDWIAAIAD